MEQLIKEIEELGYDIAKLRVKYCPLLKIPEIFCLEIRAPEYNKALEQRSRQMGLIP